MYIDYSFVFRTTVHLHLIGFSGEDASWADTIEYLSAPQNDASNAARPWTYQTCNEFGYYQTTDSKVRTISSSS